MIPPISKMNYLEFCNLIAGTKWKDLREVKAVARRQARVLEDIKDPSPKEQAELVAGIFNSWAGR